MSLSDGFDIKDLAKVLKNPDPNRGSDESAGGSSDEDEDQDETKPKTATVSNSMRVLGPSDIGNKKGGSKDKDQQKSSASECEITENEPPLSSSSRDMRVAAKESESGGSIWSQHEFGGGGDVGNSDSGPDVSHDPRKVPAYEMYFSQTVTPEDVYLQMGYKTPATSSCENLIVKITLPGEDHSSMQLELKEQRVELRSPQHILILPTPHPIDPRAGNAKWNNNTETLVLTLRLRREMDAFNF